jgi:hypothetical protein
VVLRGLALATSQPSQQHDTDLGYSLCRERRAEVTGGKIGDRPGLAAEPRACHLFDLPLPMSECYLSRVCGAGIVPCAAPGRGPAYEEIS